MEKLKTEQQTEEKLKAEPKTKTEPKAEKRTEPKKEPEAEASDPVEAEKAPDRKRQKGVWVYIGPNLKGLVQSGNIYRGSREDVLKALEGAVKEKPEVKTLLVSGEALGEARIKVKTPGNALYTTYKKLAGTA